MMALIAEKPSVTNFRRESLPIIPADFRLIPCQVKAEKGYKADPGVLKQLKVIKEVFDQCDRIIVVTDTGCLFSFLFLAPLSDFPYLRKRNYQ